MTKKILAAITAFAIATGTLVGGAATAAAKPMLPYNPTYCVLFLPSLCVPPAPAKLGAVVHKAVAKKPAKKK
jgi:hypothetical protein